MNKMRLVGTWALLGCLLLLGIGFAQSANGLDNRAYEPHGGFFSVRLPSGWAMSETDQMEEFGHYEMGVFAPGFEGLEYVRISLHYYAEPWRSPERYLYDLLHPGLGNSQPKQNEPKDTLLAGKKAVSVVKEHSRSLMGEGAVPCELRHVVCPAEVGFFVWVFDAPLTQAEKYRPTFDAVLATFQPTVSSASAALAAPAEVSTEDYEVYTDFLQTEKLPALEIPPYFEDVVRERVVSVKTVTSDAWKSQSPSQLAEAFGSDVAVLFTDLQKNNAISHVVKDRIFIPALSMRPEKRSRDFSDRGLFPGYVIFSRVGFNPGMTSALFYVEQVGAPLTSHFVLMGRRENRWVFRSAVMENIAIP